MALYSVMEHSYYDSLLVINRKCVDDSALRADGTRAQGKSRLHKAGSQLCKNFAAEGIEVAPKSVVVVSSRALAAEITAGFA